MAKTLSMKNGPFMGIFSAPRQHPQLSVRRRVIRDNLEGISKASLRRLARRGGVKRLSGLIYYEVRGVLRDFLRRVIGTALIYMSHAKRRTVSAMDVVHALKRDGRMLYGFDDRRPIAQARHKPVKPVFKRIRKRPSKSMMTTTTPTTTPTPTQMANMSAMTDLQNNFHGSNESGDESDESDESNESNE